MDYKKIYNGIIQKAREDLSRKRSNGTLYHSHHIVPKCKNGTNDKGNLVLLKLREHYICHKLLHLANPTDTKLFWAYHRMTYTKGCDKFLTSKDYEELLTKQSEINRARWSDPVFKELMSQKSKQRWDNISYRSQMSSALKKAFSDPKVKSVKSDSAKRQWENPIYRDLMTRNSQECWQNLDYRERAIDIIKNTWSNPILRDKISLMKKKQWSDPKFKKYMSNLTKNSWIENPERKLKASKTMSKSWKARPILVCNYCGKESKNTSLMNRLHFENCKMNPNVDEDRMIKEGIIVICPYCGMKSRNKPNMLRYHFDNCKQKPIKN